MRYEYQAFSSWNSWMLFVCTSVRISLLYLSIASHRTRYSFAILFTSVLLIQLVVFYKRFRTFVPSLWLAPGIWISLWSLFYPSNLDCSLKSSSLPTRLADDEPDTPGYLKSLPTQEATTLTRRCFNIGDCLRRSYRYVHSWVSALFIAVYIVH